MGCRKLLAAGVVAVMPLTAPPGAAHAATTKLVESGAYTLVQEPGDGMAPIYGLISSAKHSVEVTMYELADPKAEDDLIADARRGVDVRVLLDKDYDGGSVNAATCSYLRSHRVQVRWALADTIFHQKTITVDGAKSAIGTANLTAGYYATDRDAWVLTTNASDVRAIVSTFDEDWSREPGPPAGTSGANLVWSPGAEPAMVHLIDSARDSVYVESEEMDNDSVVDALAADARRGVRCDVVMTADREWDRNFDTLSEAGCHVATYADSDDTLYIHEKLILVDASTPHATLLIGSQNISTSSLDYNRELSIELTHANAAAILDAVADTFRSDLAGATPYSR